MEYNKFPILPRNPWQIIPKRQVHHFLTLNNQNQEVKVIKFPNFPPLDYFYKNPIDDFYKRIITSTNNFFEKAKLKKELEKKVTPLTLDELKLFLGSMVLMEDYRFPDYRDHFKEISQNFIQSPITRFMHLGRFQILLKYMALDTNELYSDNHRNYEPFNFFLESLQGSDFQISENLVLIVKKLKFQKDDKSRILMVFDQSGYALNGIIVGDSEIMNRELFLSKIIKVLLKFSGKNHTLIIPSLFFSINFIDFIQKKLSFKCISLLLQPSSQPFDYENLPHCLLFEPFIENSSIYSYNSETALMALKKKISNNTTLFMIMGSDSCYNSDSDKDLCDQTWEFVENIYAKIKKLWKITIWKEFDPEHMKWSMELILFIFQVFFNNSYILYNSTYDDGFAVFKHAVIDDLLISSEKKIVIQTPCKRNHKNVENGIKQHFPDKMNYCKICKVCKKSNDLKKIKKKTLYKCKACSVNFGRDIPLCAYPCFGIYHSDIEKFNKRKQMFKKEKLLKNTEM